MKIVTKNVVIENENFILIKDKCEISEHYPYGVYFGTISYNDINESGKLKRQLNGFDMCAENTIGKALARRKENILIQKWKKENPKASLSEFIDKVFEITKVAFNEVPKV